MSSNDTRKTRKTAAPSAVETGRTQGSTTSFGVTEKSALQVSSAFANIRSGFDFVAKYLKLAGQWAFGTVTKLGWASLTFTLLWLPLGVWLGWPEFAFLGAVATAIVLFAIPFLLGKREYKIDFEFNEDHLVAGEAASAPILVTNTNSKIQLSGQLDLKLGDSIEEFNIPVLRAGETKRIPFEIAPQPRGVIPLGPMTLIRTDPVGVLRNEVELLESREVWVHPKIKVLPRTTMGFMRDLEGNSTQNIVEADLTFHSIRQYVPGDNPKHIHWKATAKLSLPGEFLIRQYEESRRSRMVIIFALKPEEYLQGTEEFEVAVSAVASLGTRALMDGRDLSIVTSSDVPNSTREIRAVSRKPMMQDLCLVNPSELAMPLIDVCRITKTAYADLSLAVVVVGSSYTARELQRIRSVLPENIGVLFVTADGRDEATPKYYKASSIDVLNIQEIQDLPGLLGRYRG